MARPDTSETYALTEGADPNDLNRWTLLAQNHWLKSTKLKRVSPDVIKKDIWDILVAEGFDFRSLLALDNLQLLEKYTSANLGMLLLN